MPIDCDCNTTLPYSVLRWIRAYRPRHRAIIARLLQDRQEGGRALTAQDIAECVGLALEVMEAEVESRVELPAPDMEMVNASLQAARENRGSTIDEILDALP